MVLEIRRNKQIEDVSLRELGVLRNRPSLTNKGSNYPIDDFSNGIFPSLPPIPFRSPDLSLFYESQPIETALPPQTDKSNDSSYLPAIFSGVILAVGVVALGLSSPAIAAIGLLGVLLLASGCGENENPLKYFGKGSTQCDGKAFRQDVVSFEKDYVTPEKETAIRMEIQRRTSTARMIKETNFCKFNGIQITSGAVDKSRAEDPKESRRQAYYEPRSRMIYLSASLLGMDHELWHFFGDQYGIFNGGVYASATPRWQNSSCAVQGWFEKDPKKCIVEKNFPKPYSEQLQGEEEHAEGGEAGNILMNSVGALYNFATDPNSFEQVLEHMSVVGFSEEAIKTHSRKILLPPRQVSIQGGLDSSFYINGQPLSTSASLFTGSEGGFGFVGIEVFLFTPSAQGDSWALHRLSIPSYDRTQEQYPALYTYGNNQVAVWRNGKIYLGDANAFTGWNEKVTQNIPSSPYGSQFRESLSFVDKKLIYFGKNNYWDLEDLTETPKNYPSEIQEGMIQARELKIIDAKGKRFLWIEGIAMPPFGEKGALFQLDSQNNEVQFKKIFEIPVSKFSYKPFFYGDAWHLFVRPTNNYLSDQFEFSPSGLGVLRIEQGGNQVIPFEDRYPGNDINTFSRIAGLMDKTKYIFRSGNKLVGFAEYAGVFSLDLSF